MESDKLVKAFDVKEYFKRVIFGADQKIDAWVDCIPAVDAVEVVRCRECQRWHTKNCAMGDYPMYTDADDYCSWGQRREEEHNAAG